MKDQHPVLLPGLNRQITFLKAAIKTEPKNILLIGASSEQAAIKLNKIYGCPVEVIVEDYESLLLSNLIFEDKNEITAKLMDYEITDYGNDHFDMIYAQASISDLRRNKIVKEIKRILKPGGVFCLGEVVKLKDEIPPFVKDIFSLSDMDPLFVDTIQNYYKQRKFEIVGSLDLSNTLEEYYQTLLDELKKIKKKQTEEETKKNKRLMDKVRHESQSYLKTGGRDFMGFYVMVMRKEEG